MKKHTEKTSEITGELKVTVARSMHELDAIRPVLDEMDVLPSEFFLNVHNTEREIERPHVILLSREGPPETAVTGRIETGRIECKIGPKVLFTVTVRALTFLENAVHGRTSRSNCSVLLSELFRSLKRKEADLVSFHDVPIDSHLFKVAKGLPNFISRDFFPVVDNHWVMTTPSSMDEFYRSRSGDHRRHLKRIARRLEKEFSGSVVVKRFRTRGETGQLLRESEEISKKTYQFAFGGGIIQNEESTRLMHSLADREILRGYILYLDDQPSSFYIGFVNKNGLNLLYTGYDPQYRKYEIGTFLMMKVIEDGIKDEGIRYIDFQYSDSFQKRRLGDKSSEVVHFLIFQPTLRGLYLNGIKLFNDLSSRAGDWLVNLVNVKDKYERYKKSAVNLEEKNR